MKICLVEWGDAWVDTKDITKAEAKKLKSVKRQTIGFFAEETDEGLVLCTDLYSEDKDELNTPMFIPWGMIIDWFELEIEEHEP